MSYASIERVEKRSFVAGTEFLRPNEIPSIAVWGRVLPEAWEDSVLATWEFGTTIPTEYDQPVDPESKDATVMITVTSPFVEPRIHKNLPCGLDDLEIYTREVVDGVHDLLVGERGWSYSYHDRLRHWPGINGWREIEKLVGQKIAFPKIDQIDALVNKLALVPHSRRAQAITWNPLVDATHHEPPCLQRVWCRVVRSENELYLLEMNTHWRSRDAFKAAFMNMYALVELQKKIAEGISEVSGRRVEVGRYVDISDSYHIYGSYVRKKDVARFLHQIEYLGFERRTFRSDDPRAQDAFAGGRERLAKERQKNVSTKI